MSDLRLPRLLVIGEVEAVRASLLTRLAAGEDLALDASELAGLDTAGLQLLLSARKSALAAGRQFALRGLPPELRRVLEVTGTAALLASEGSAP